MIELKQKKINKAFSLIELSVVILIIGILISGVVSGTYIIAKSRITVAAKQTENSPVSYIPNLAFWVETTSDNSFDDVDVSKGLIATWKDINSQSNDKNNATQATTANQPAYVTNVINGLPVLRFSGASTTMAVSGSIFDYQEYTMFIVERRTAANAGYMMLPSGFGIKVGYGSTSEMRVLYFSGANDWVPVTIASYSQPIPRIITAFGKPTYGTGHTTANLAINGTLLFSDVLGRISYGYSPTYYIGASSYTGDIGEIIVFKRALKNSERADVEEYLAKKWKITLGS